MKINIFVDKWKSVVIGVTTLLTVLVLENVNGHKIISETDLISIKQTPNLSVGITENTLQLTNGRNPATNNRSKYDTNVAKNTSEAKSHMVVRSRNNGGKVKVNKTKKYQTQNRFDFIWKHSRLKKSASHNVSMDTKTKISTPEVTINLTDTELAHYRKLYLKLRMKKQMEFDAEISYLCMVFLILVICLASWYAGICRIRKHSVMEVVDFESSQPLTTVKDVMLRKSRYLPMFKNFYNKKKKISRGTNPLY